MAKLIYGMNQSLDGYVNFDKFAPDPVLFRHFIEVVRNETGMIYGRGIYEIMQYWDEEQEGWGDDEKEYAKVWREKPKWVFSSSLTSVGPNATLVTGDLGTEVRKIRDAHDGTIEVAGPVLAGSLTALVLIDEYQIYLHPVVINGGDPFFVGETPRLKLVGTQQIGDQLQLRYVPA